MARRGFLTGGASLLVLVIAVGVVGAGDRDIAELLYGKGEKAYRKKAYEEAAGHYERALEESSPYPEAAYKLGMCLEKLGKGKEALEAYLVAEKQFGELSKLTRRQNRALSTVRKNISRIGAGYAELTKLDAEFVKKCVALSRRYFNSRPSWAKKAAESALAIDPTNQLAKGFLEKLGSTSAPTSVADGFTPLITDDRLKGWDPGVEPPWTCSGGVMTMDPKDTTGHPNFYKKRLEGEFEFQASFRPLTIDSNKRVFGLMFGNKADMTAWSLGIDWSNELVLVKWDREKNEPVQSKILSDFKANRWYRIGIRVDGSQLTALLNGKVAFRYVGLGADAFDGAAGVIGQCMKIEVKEVGVKE
jgi:hypothetical protein